MRIKQEQTKQIRLITQLDLFFFFIQVNKKLNLFRENSTAKKVILTQMNHQQR